MSSLFLKSCATTISLMLCIIFVQSESNNTISTIVSTKMIDTMSEDPPPDAPQYVYLMIGSGMVGMILIAAFAIHSMYHFIHDDINHGLSRWLYISYFSFSWILCFSYSFLKSNLIFPMGTSIDCKVGMYCIAYSLIFCKIALFLIFMYRIDIAFHSSALAYPRKCLSIIIITYIILGILLNVGYVLMTYKDLKLIKLPYFGNESDGMCTFGSDVDTSIMMVVLGGGALADIIYSILVGSLFVYKLNKVVKMTESQPQKSMSLRASTNNRPAKENRLQKVMKKQTILVSLACISDIIFIGMYVADPSINLLLPMDTIINVFCAWLMFTFADPVWNKIVKICCCCCYCFAHNKHNLLITLHSLPKAFSMNSNSTKTKNNHNHTTKNNSNNSVKHNDIEIDFGNAKNITLDKKTNNDIVGKYDNNPPESMSNPAVVSDVSKTTDVSTTDIVTALEKATSNSILQLMRLETVESTRL
eukprot:259669_1